MKRSRSFFWGKTPVLRILIPFVTGIIVQWYGQLHVHRWYLLAAVVLISLLLFFTFSYFHRFRLAFVHGILFSLLFTCFGGILAWNKDIRNDSKWYGCELTDSTSAIIVLEEPLLEKEKSYRASASVKGVISSGKIKPAVGRILIYFSKDSSFNSNGLDYGSTLIVNKPVQPVKNTGNPGAFDFERYCLFQGITGQVFLRPQDYRLLPGSNATLTQRLLFPIRAGILGIIRKYIPGEKEKGLAEALLVGYKNDLDKSLVQSYSNTGVVHVIAISGLHIGLIYWVLLIVLKPITRWRYSVWLHPLIIIAGLWAFSLMAGGSPSVLRSAVMFTCIVAGQSLKRHGQVYNTMSFSALILLCYNPFWLWDIGFQLSYAAVLSIIIFMKPVYNWFFIKNKILDFFWKLNAVTIAAQILTLPFTIFHFHQFPNYFMLANVVAVPLSSVIVLGEIILCAVAWIPGFASVLGSILGWLIRQMNVYISKIESLPHAVWDGIQMNLVQALLLIGFIAATGWWLMEKRRQSFIISLCTIFIYLLVEAKCRTEANQQKCVIIYNVQGKSAIDFISGRHYVFHGDSAVENDKPVRDFHLRPARVRRRVNRTGKLPNLHQSGNIANFEGSRFFFINQKINFVIDTLKPYFDLVIVSGNPGIYMDRLAASINFRQIVFDGSVPGWKLRYWKKDCDSLGISHHAVSEKGAFVMNLN